MAHRPGHTRRRCDDEAVRYPVFLDLSGRLAVVVGGGAVGVRRCRGLLDAGAEVRVVASEPSDELPSGVTVVGRAFDAADLDGAWFVVACTDDADVNDAVAAAAGQRGIWCSRSDDADRSPVWVPAAGSVDDVQIAVTAGGDPGRARALRDDATRALRSGEWRAARTRRGTGRVV